MRVPGPAMGRARLVTVRGPAWAGHATGQASDRALPDRLNEAPGGSKVRGGRPVGTYSYSYPYEW